MAEQRLDIIIDGDASGLEAATARASQAIAGMSRQLAAVRPTVGARNIEAELRGLEAAGRAVGGRFGEMTGLLGDVSDALGSTAGKAGLAGAGLVALTAAVGSAAYGMTSLVRAAREVGTATGDARVRLDAAGRAMEALDAATGRLTVSLGSAAAPAVTRMELALAGLVGVMDDAVQRGVPSGFGTALGGALAMFSGPLGAMVGANLYATARGIGAVTDALAARGQADADASGGLSGFGVDQRNAAMRQAFLANLMEMQQREAEARDWAANLRATDLADQQRAADEARRLEEEQAREITERNRAAHDFVMDLRREQREARQRELEEIRAIEFESLEEITAKEAEETEKRRAIEEQQRRERMTRIAEDVSMASQFLGAGAELISTLVTNAEGDTRRSAKTVFAIQKAAALGQIGIQTAVAVIRALAELGPVAGGIAAGGIVALGALQAATVAAQQPRFHVGGVMRGGGPLAPDERRIQGGTILASERVVLTRQGQDAAAIAALNAGRIPAEAATPPSITLMLDGRVIADALRPLLRGSTPYGVR